LSRPHHCGGGPGLPAKRSDVNADPGAFEECDCDEMRDADRLLEDLASAVDEAGAVAAITLSVEPNVSTRKALVEPGSSSSCSAEPPKPAVPALPSSLQRAAALSSPFKAGIRIFFSLQIMKSAKV
jgi:hypothetical protein